MFDCLMNNFDKNLFKILIISAKMKSRNRDFEKRKSFDQFLNFLEFLDR